MTDNRTIELREKLDALGIVHFDYDKGDRTQTLWKSPEDTCYFTYETVANPDKTARLVIEWFPTLEQAIALTLGNGTCEMEYIDTYEYPDGEEDYLCKCSKCGRKSWEPAHNLPKFCGGCGARVID